MLEHLCVLSVTDSPESGTRAYNLRRPSAITRSAYPWVQLLVAGHFVFRHPRFRDPDPPPPVKFMTRLMYRRSAGPDRRHAAHSMKQMRVHPRTYHTRTYQVSVQVLSQALATPRFLLHNFGTSGHGSLDVTMLFRRKFYQDCFAEPPKAEEPPTSPRQTSPRFQPKSGNVARMGQITRRGKSDSI